MTTEPMFLHGTRRGFKPGGVLLPRAQHGGQGTNAPVNPGATPPPDAVNWVYLTTALDVAWLYAHHAPGRGKPKVLVMQPHGTVEPDPEHSAAMSAWRAEWATVTRVMNAAEVEDRLRAEHGDDFDPEAYKTWEVPVDG